MTKKFRNVFLNLDYVYKTHLSRIFMDRSKEIQICSYECKLILKSLSLFKVTGLGMLSKSIVSQMDQK